MSAVLAQLVERTTEDRAVAGSKPADGILFFLQAPQRLKGRGAEGKGMGWRGGYLESKRPSLFFLAPLSPLDFFHFLSPLFPLPPRSSPPRDALPLWPPTPPPAQSRAGSPPGPRRPYAPSPPGPRPSRRGDVFSLLFWLALVSSWINWTSKSQKPLRASRLGLVFPDELT